MKGRSLSAPRGPHTKPARMPLGTGSFSEPDPGEDHLPPGFTMGKKRGGKVHGSEPKRRLDKRARGGKLSTKERNDLPEGDFALPGRRYPIENASHARNALARVSQHGTPSEKAEVRSKVHREYPGIGHARGGDVKDHGKVRMAAARRD